MTEHSHDSPTTRHNPFTAPMATGRGVKGKASGSITYEDLVSDATRTTENGARFNWLCVAKQEARWLLPSALASRSAAQQVEMGSYLALLVDIDNGKLQFDGVESAVSAAKCGSVALIYSTKSATFDAPRWRVVIPLERPLRGADYADTAQALYIRIREASDGRVDPDDAVARPGQISFLPNAPAGDPTGDNYLAYAAEVGDDPDCALNLTDDHPIVRLREARRREMQRQADATAAKAKHRRGGAPKGRTSLIDRFNVRHRIEELLNRHRYDQATDPSGRWPTDHWRSPYQTSGSYATRLYRGDDGDEWWVSLSGSDAKRGLGAKSAGGGARYGDAFDLYVHFEHGGDIGAAREAWKMQCDDNRCVEVGRGLARRSIELATQRDRLRALSSARGQLSDNGTNNDILKRMRGFGERNGGGTEK